MPDTFTPDKPAPDPAPTIIPGGRPGIPAPEKIRRPAKRLAHQERAPFMHEHSVARHTLKGE